jgi:hypothetical protein
MTSLVIGLTRGLPVRRATVVEGPLEQPKIGVAITSEQSTFSYQVEKHARSNSVSSLEISSGEKIIDSTKIGG